MHEYEEEEHALRVLMREEVKEKMSTQSGEDQKIVYQNFFLAQLLVLLFRKAWLTIERLHYKQEMVSQSLPSGKTLCACISFHGHSAMI